jgi:hypothetical protein
MDMRCSAGSMQMNVVGENGTAIAWALRFVYGTGTPGRGGGVLHTSGAQMFAPEPLLHAGSIPRSYPR